MPGSGWVPVRTHCSVFAADGAGPADDFCLLLSGPWADSTFFIFFDQLPDCMDSRHPLLQTSSPLKANDKV
jgi:hypothetical protein